MSADPGAAGGGVSVNRLAALLLVMLTAIGLALALAAWFSFSDDAPSDQAATGTTTDVSTKLRSGVTTFRLHPRRGAAHTPLVLDAEGAGCRPGVGVLSVYRLGTAVDVEPAEQGGELVLRRRFDIGRDGRWGTQPLLVDQPTGKYRVVAACPRTASAGSLVSSSVQPDTIDAVEILELTGPASLTEFSVSPSSPPAGTAVDVVLEGSSSCPEGIAGNVFRPSDPAAAARSFVAIPDSAGSWRKTLSFSATEATGSYSVEARCTGRFALVTQQLRFVDPAQRHRPVSWSGSRRAAALPATPLPGRPTFTG